jgi:hypothetical protein
MQLARKLLFSGIAILFLAGAMSMATYLHGQAYQTDTLGEQPFDIASLDVPPAQQDACLHCHIQGEHTNLWTPTSRWLVFGTLGLVFLFGFYQSASIWTQRKPFKPLTKRAYEWVDERYKISGVLSA